MSVLDASIDTERSNKIEILVKTNHPNSFTNYILYRTLIFTTGEFLTINSITNSYVIISKNMMTHSI